MQKSYRFIVSALLLGAFLLSACSGAMPAPGNDNGAAGVNSNQVDDTINSNDNSVNANANTNSNTNSNDDNSNGNVNANSNSNANGNANGNDNSNTAPSGPEQEFFGTVQAITKDSITINGVTYKLAGFTEFKGTIAPGDQVKIHVIVNADGTFTIREIEKTSGAGIGNTNSNSNVNSNSNGNSNDDNRNSNSNSNSNDNDDDDNDNDSNDNG